MRILGSGVIEKRGDTSKHVGVFGFIIDRIRARADFLFTEKFVVKYARVEVSAFISYSP